MEPGSPELAQASRSLDGRAVRRGPPGDLCSQRGGGMWREEGQGGQEKYLRSRNNGLFSAVQPGLRDRPVGWRPALPWPDHLQHHLPPPTSPSPWGFTWPHLDGTGGSFLILHAHSWMYGSICFLLTKAGQLGSMKGFHRHSLLQTTESNFPLAPACSWWSWGSNPAFPAPSLGFAQ